VDRTILPPSVLLSIGVPRTTATLESTGGAWRLGAAVEDVEWFVEACVHDASRMRRTRIQADPA
jgi:hypothetical protein